MGPQEAKYVDDEDLVENCEGFNMKLKDLIKENKKEYIGTGYTKKYPEANGEINFFVKIASIGTALSIHLHPEKKDAERLH